MLIRVACYREIPGGEVREHNIDRKDGRGARCGEPVVGGREPGLQSTNRLHCVPGSLQPHLRQGDRRGGGGRAGGEAGEGAGRVRGALVEQQVLGRRLVHAGRSVSPALCQPAGDRRGQQRAVHVPYLSAWWNDILSRPTFQKVLALQKQ